ncbi:chitobiase/beta-hexosaminidase C-terminal domain-containing protein [Fictibacillus phosphorivorans]|nr:chitobiase/beta-hexosaminidase C-terminal domain-containing protein [Fictibacillus phosphorivorans]MCM3776591.1 chitobiase/beta-hexosaminidase C-terminal domain-containing protein [Fictibacillus phosphorivorans]
MSEPATIYYTLDGCRPTYDSPKLQLSGTREGAESLLIDRTTTLKWFAVDACGNIENNYNPVGTKKNYRSETYVIK